MKFIVKGANKFELGFCIVCDQYNYVGNNCTDQCSGNKININIGINSVSKPKQN